MKCTHLKDGICQYEGAICKYREHEEYTCRSQLDLLMHNKWVREKCKSEWVDKASGVKFSCKELGSIGSAHCPFCHGTGYIERPAEVEEVREVIVWALSADESGFYLPSGATLFMKEKE